MILKAITATAQNITESIIANVILISRRDMKKLKTTVRHTAPTINDATKVINHFICFPNYIIFSPLQFLFH